jgi:hypothetical protein
MTPVEIEQKMDELACKYSETHDPDIPYELYKLARELEKIKKESLEWATHITERTALRR